MFKTFLILALFFTLSCEAQATANSPELIDDTQTSIKLTNPAQRVVILYAGFEELILSLDKTNKIVGRTDLNDSPALKKLPSVGTHMRPNLEQIIALNPDLVLQMNSDRPDTQESIKKLRELGLTVAVFNLESFADIFSVLERLAVLLDAKVSSDDFAGQFVGENKGKILSKIMQERLHKLSLELKELTPAERPKVFFELRYPNILGAGKDSLQNEIITHAGADNVLKKYQQRLVKLDEEELLILAPNFFIMQQGPMYKSPVPLEKRPVLKVLQEQNKTQTLIVNALDYSHPGLHSVEAVFKLAQVLHPHLTNINLIK